MSDTLLAWSVLHLPSAGADGSIEAWCTPRRGRETLSLRLQDVCCDWLTELRADHRPGSIGAVAAAEMRAPAVLRAIDALLRSHAPEQLLLPSAEAGSVAGALRWRVTLANQVGSTRHTLSALPSAECHLFGLPSAPANLPLLLLERIASALALSNASQQWLLQQLTAFASPLADTIGELLADPSPPDGSADRGTAGPSQSRLLAQLWLDSQVREPGTPMALRTPLARLQPELEQLGERDPGFWQCSLHPLRRLLNDWLASLTLQHLRGSFLAEQVDAEISELRQLLRSYEPVHVGAAANGLLPAPLLRARVLRDAGLLQRWGMTRARALVAANDPQCPAQERVRRAGVLRLLGGGNSSDDAAQRAAAR